MEQKELTKEIKKEISEKIDRIEKKSLEIVNLLAERNTKWQN